MRERPSAVPHARTVDTYTPYRYSAHIRANARRAATMTDPVCGMTVDPETAAAAWEHDGTVYYFCSGRCMDSFRADPEHFLGLDPSERHM